MVDRHTDGNVCECERAVLINDRTGHHLLDHRYFISGSESGTAFDTSNGLINVSGLDTSTLFVAPGAPRGYFVGRRYDFGPMEG